MISRRIATGLAVLFAAAVLSATSVIPISDQELYRRADVVAHGLVLSNRAEIGPFGFVETVTEIQVFETFKGHSSGNLVLRTVGGRLPDGTETAAAGQPRYRVGQEVVVFATLDPEGEYRITEFLLGKFEVWVDAGGRKFALPPLATPESTSVNIVDVPREAAGALVPRELESFLSSLRARESGRIAIEESPRPPAGRLVPSDESGSGIRPEWSIAWAGASDSYRWPETTPITVQTIAASVDGGVCNASAGTPAIAGGSNGTAEFNAALATWNSDAARSGTRLVSGVVAGSGVSVYPNTDHVYGWFDGPGADGVIGLTFLGGLSCVPPAPTFETHTWRSRTFRSLVNPAVYIRARACWSSKHYQAVLTHELGHALGLWHSRNGDGSEPRDAADSCPTDTWESIMQGISPIQGYLGADDIAALRFDYATDPTPLLCNGAPPGRPAYPDTFNWVDEASPAGASVTANFAWDSVHRISLEHSHTDGPASGMHQHFFVGATQTMTPGQTDILTCYVWLDSCNPPQEVMLQWNDGSWEHRAFWGNDALAWGAIGTPAHVKMGPLPALGQWVLLEVPASTVGLSGQTVNGMAFTQFDGQVFFDRAGLRPRYRPVQPGPGLPVVPRGPTSGGTRVVIPGSGFVAGARVTFGGIPATSVSVDSGTQITAVTPAHIAGAVEIVITNPDGQSGYLPGAFTYVDLAPAYQGYLDVAACDQFTGWAWNATYPTTPIQVDIYLDSAKIATIPASSFRGDLAAAGIGDGYHAFSYAAPASVRNGGSHVIDVRAAGGPSLTASPKSLTCADGASFVSQSVPSVMAPGATATVFVTMRNSGATAWTESNSIRLGSQNTENNTTWGLGRVYLAPGEVVSAGASKTFSFTITAPAATGTYNFQWRMLREMVRWFGDYTLNVTVVVGTPPAPTGCVPNGTSLAAGATSVTMACNPTPGASRYAIRLQDNTDGSLRSTWTCPGTPTIYLCVNDIPSSSYTSAVVPGHSYTWWMHAGNAYGYSSPTYASFTVPVVALHAPTGLAKDPVSRNLLWTPPGNLTGADAVTYDLRITGGANCAAGCLYHPGAPSWYTMGAEIGTGTYTWTLKANSASRPSSGPVSGPSFTMP